MHEATENSEAGIDQAVVESAETLEGVPAEVGEGESGCEGLDGAERVPREKASSKYKIKNSGNISDCQDESAED